MFILDHIYSLSEYICSLKSWQGEFLWDQFKRNSRMADNLPGCVQLLFFELIIAVLGTGMTVMLSFYSELTFVHDLFPTTCTINSYAGMRDDLVDRYI